MSITRALRNFCRAICRAFGVTAAATGSDGLVIAAASTSTRQPAVAGFIHRLTLADRFMLARRLASTARLNVPAGRKPFGVVRRSTGLPPIPAVRLGAKKTRLSGNAGPRVLDRSRPANTSATIIPFSRPAGRPARQLAKAA